MTLGQVLKEARQRNRMSLRDVEKLVRISNGHLSLLESDLIKSPSPNHLHQLAELFGVSYSLLLELAGYVVPETSVASNARLAGNLGDLTNEELAQVRSFVGFLKASRQSGESDR